MNQKTFEAAQQRMINVHNALNRDGHTSSDISHAMFFTIVEAFYCGGTPPEELRGMLNVVIDSCIENHGPVETPEEGENGP